MTPRLPTRSSTAVMLRAAFLAAFVAAVAALALPRTAAAQRSAATTADSARPKVRMRLVGVYDGETGAAIEGADVSDLSTGLTSRTTKTGTVALLFVDTTASLVRIKKVGYQAATVLVGTAFADTTPVTTTLLRSGHALAPVITIGDRSVLLGAGDTISTLLRNGFYERRETGGAPRSAFISGDKIKDATLVSDAHYYGRGICESNVYIDGMPFVVPHRTGHFLKEGIDAVINPFDVAGIETYTTGEAPINGAHTTAGAGSLDLSAGAANAVASAAGSIAGTGCVTMIWLRQ